MIFTDQDKMYLTTLIEQEQWSLRHGNASKDDDGKYSKWLMAFASRLILT